MALYPTRECPNREGRARSWVRVLALASVLALGATACAQGGPSTDTSSSSPELDKKQASTALAAGLEAHSDGNVDDAVAEYTKALEFDPTNKFAFYNLALIDEANGNYGLAEDNYRAALETDPAYGPALFNLAILRTDTDPKDAISLYKEAVAANRKDAAAWLNLGLLQRANGKERAGDVSVLRAIALNPVLHDPDATTSGDDDPA